MQVCLASVAGPGFDVPSIGQSRGQSRHCEEGVHKNAGGLRLQSWDKGCPGQVACLWELWAGPVV